VAAKAAPPRAIVKHRNSGFSFILMGLLDQSL
jgi:hypothetical protein